MKKKPKGVPFEHNLEFLVDPFFRRTTQMFDEASAKGMLMNNLHISKEHMLALSSGVFGHQKEEEKTPKMQGQDYMKYLDKYTVVGLEDAYKASNLNEDLAQFLEEGGIHPVKTQP